MAHLRVDDKRYELSRGELRVGTAADADLRLEAASGLGTVAIVGVDGARTETVRRASPSAVPVDGAALGAEPSPLLHGDRIEVAWRQLRFSDDQDR